jgi:hypothetical protein
MERFGSVDGAYFVIVGNASAFYPIRIDCAASEQCGNNHAKAR